MSYTQGPQIFFQPVILHLNSWDSGPLGHGYTGQPLWSYHLRHVSQATLPSRCVTLRQQGTLYSTCAHKGDPVQHFTSTDLSQALLSVAEEPTRTQGSGGPSRARARSPPQVGLGCLKACQVPPNQGSSEADLGHAIILSSDPHWAWVPAKWKRAKPGL